MFFCNENCRCGYVCLLYTRNLYCRYLYYSLKNYSDNFVDIQISNMDQILKEVRELKSLLSELIGTKDLPKNEKFSKAAIEKAAKEFKKLSIERGEWIEDYHIDRIIKNAPYHAGKFIIKEFQFSNYFKKGQRFYFNKKDITALAKELKKRNIDLKRYIEYKEDLERFRKYLDAAKENKLKAKKKAFVMGDIFNIASSPPKPPSVDVIRDDIAKLKEEFFESKLGDYIDIYDSNHAMLKSIYWIEKYLEPELKKRCKRWCENFNYANHALTLVTNKKEKFVPVKEDDMIEL